MLDSFVKTPLQQGNLKDQIANLVKSAILSGDLVPDITYKMGGVADQLGVSRTPVREALLELEARGLVEITRSVGFKIVSPSKDDMRDIFELRVLLEVPTMVRLAGHLSSEQHDQARELVDEIEQPAKANDLAEFLRLDKAFHVYVIGLAGNRRLTQLVADLRDSQRMPGLYRLTATGQGLVARNDEHRDILSAMVAGDPDEVERLIRNHLALSREAWDVSPGHLETRR